MGLLFWAVVGMLCHFYDASPKIYLHIGPHKTATTYIQSVFTSEVISYHYNPFDIAMFIFLYVKQINLLSRNHIIFPTAKDFGLSSKRNLEVKEMARFFDYIKSNFTSEIKFGKKVISLVSELREKKRSLILSSEGLSILDIEKIRYLHDLFDGFEVKVITIYRAYGCRILSLFNQIAASTETPDYAFSSTLLYRYMDTIWMEDYEDMLQRYSTVFGRRSIQIIDYYGALAADQNLAKIIICQIMNVPSLCTEEATQANKLLATNKSVNARKDIENKQMRLLFQAYAFQNNCKYKDSEHGNFILNSIEWRNVPKPVQTNFTLLQKYSFLTDQRLREKYSTQIIYGNRTANVVAVVEELSDYGDISPFAAARSPLAEEMKNVLNKIKAKKFCG